MNRRCTDHRLVSVRDVLMSAAAVVVLSTGSVRAADTDDSVPALLRKLSDRRFAVRSQAERELTHSPPWMFPRSKRPRHGMPSMRPELSGCWSGFTSDPRPCSLRKRWPGPRSCLQWIPCCRFAAWVPTERRTDDRGGKGAGTTFQRRFARCSTRRGGSRPSCDSFGEPGDRKAAVAGRPGGLLLEP